MPLCKGLLGVKQVQIGVIQVKGIKYLLSTYSLLLPEFHSECTGRTLMMNGQCIVGATPVHTQFTPGKEKVNRH